MIDFNRLAAAYERITGVALPGNAEPTILQVAATMLLVEELDNIRFLLSETDHYSRNK